MNFWDAVKSCFRQYVGFQGRAARSEYWLWMLFNMVVSAVLHGLEGGMAEGVPGPLGSAWNIGTFLPSLAVAVRRLHDTERSGWWLMLPTGALFAVGAATGALTIGAPNGGGLSGIGAAVLGLAVLAWVGVMGLYLVWFCSCGTRGPNTFGADPLAA